MLVHQRNSHLDCRLLARAARDVATVLLSELSTYPLRYTHVHILGVISLRWIYCVDSQQVLQCQLGNTVPQTLNAPQRRDMAHF